MKNLQRSISQNLLKRASSRCHSTKSAQSTRSSRSTKSSKARRVREKELRELNRRYQQQCNGWGRCKDCVYLTKNIGESRTTIVPQLRCQLPAPSPQSQLAENLLLNFSFIFYTSAVFLSFITFYVSVLFIYCWCIFMFMLSLEIISFSFLPDCICWTEFYVSCWKD